MTTPQPSGTDWEAAVEAGAQSLYRLGWNMSEAEDAAEHILTAALPHLRRHIIAELKAEAEAEGKRNREGTLIPRQFDGTPFPNLTDAAGAARWFAAQEATDE
jgi:hypothetical protein